MGTLQAIVLGIVQGLTEFLPVSSSGHLALMEHIFGRVEGQADAMLAFDVLLHLASVAAILMVLWKDAISLLTRRRRLILPLIAGTIPAAIAGMLFEEYFDAAKGSLLILGAGFMFTGIVLALGERLGRKTGRLDGVGLREAAAIGIGQAVAILPAVSRSGMTMSSGLLMGLNRTDCLRFSFLLAIPVILGAAVKETPKMLHAAGTVGLAPLVAGAAASCVFSIMAIKLLLGIVRRHPLSVFSYYVVPLGMALFVWQAPAIFAGWAGRTLGYVLTAAIAAGVAVAAVSLLRKRPQSRSAAQD